MPGCDSKPSMEIKLGPYLLVATTTCIVYTRIDIEAISSLSFKNPENHERRQCHGQHSEGLRALRNDAGPTRRRLGLRRSDREEACLAPPLSHVRPAHLDSASCGPHIGCQNERSCEMRKARVTCASLKLVPFGASTQTPMSRPANGRQDLGGTPRQPNTNLRYRSLSLMNAAMAIRQPLRNVWTSSMT